MIEWLGTSWFSYLEGASDPEELLKTAQSLGYEGLALADRMGMYGAVQGLSASDEIADELRDKTGKGFFYAPGIRLHFDAADPLFIYPNHRGAHGALCEFLTAWALEGMSAREKGLTALPWRRFLDFLAQGARSTAASGHSLARDYVLIAAPGRFYPWVSTPKESEVSRLRTQDAQAPGPSFHQSQNFAKVLSFNGETYGALAEICGEGEASALSLAYPLTFSPGSEELLQQIEERALRLRIPLLATTLPLYAARADQDLCDVVTAIRHCKTVKELGYLRQVNGERCLLGPDERAVHARIIEAKQKRGRITHNPFERGHALTERHSFSLRELRYHYPRERLSPGENSTQYLRRRVFEGLAERYQGCTPPATLKQVNYELDLIAQLGFEDYFLTIFDVLQYAREQKILFQGRGSAANSTVCYALGITAIDPVRMNLLFERFISAERGEPPDIDVDFEHERREEVLQEVYRRYGREHAAMVATSITFRGRMAARECAKALGFAPELIDDLVRFMGREGLSRLMGEPDPRLIEILRKHKVGQRRWDLFLNLTPRLKGRPRHLSIHTGGFVLSSEKLSRQCVLEPGRMENRSVVPWDKDDVDYLGWMKVDLLSLGMLTAIRKAFELIGSRNITGAPLTLASTPAECPRVYHALCRADTVGVFQVESRAQMNMLPRLGPRHFYDIVIEVAIVRPGPIQGGMVHPYLKRRQGIEKVHYDHPTLEPILKKTLGVPIFQEQVMKIAVAVAGFRPGEADQLRKVMSGAWRARSSIRVLRDKLLTGLAANGLTGEFAERIYKQIEGFGEYGFPESHAASFAILTYVSTWLKVHHPAEFLCALLNSQPMGFYSPRALIADAERHQVRVLPVDIFASQWESALDCDWQARPALEKDRAPDSLCARFSEDLAQGGNSKNAAMRLHSGVAPHHEKDRPTVRLGFHLVEGLKEAEARLIEKLRAEAGADNGSDVKSPKGNTSAPGLQSFFEGGVKYESLEKLVRAGACRGLEHTHDPRREQLWQLMSLRRSPRATPLLNLNEPARPRIAALNEWESILMDYRATGCSTNLRHPARYAREKIFPDRRWITAEGLYALADRTRCRVLGLLSVFQKPPTASGLVFLSLEDETGFFNLSLMPDVYEACRHHIQPGLLAVAEGTLQRSCPLDPEDQRTSAVGIRVTRFWNPFLSEQGLQAHDLRSVHAF